MNLIILVYVPNFFLSIPYVLTKADAYANSATLPYDSIDTAVHSTFVELLWSHSLQTISLKFLLVTPI